MAPTPVHRWCIPGLPSGFNLFIKRDDLTGCSTSGNKVRKAEFILAEALHEKSDCVVTMGGVYSNHARTTALVAREIGLDTILFILTQPSQPGSANESDCHGNMLLNRLSGAEVIMCPRVPGASIRDVDRVSTLMQDHARKLRNEGRNPYIIPVGGSCILGEWGYIEAWDELLSQKQLDNIDDVVLAIGNGGTACGLAIGNYLTGSKVKIHAIVVTTTAAHLYEVIGQSLIDIGLSGVEPEALIDLIDGYLLGGYGAFNQELKELVVSIAGNTGIILDTIYTGKAIFGMMSEMKKNPNRFKGTNILFINTGGIFNSFNGILDDMFEATS